MGLRRSLYIVLILCVVPAVVQAQEITRPDDYITRAEIAALLAHTFYNKEFVASSLHERHFADVKRTDWYAGPMNALVADSVWQGGRNARPHDAVARKNFLVTMFAIGGISTDAFPNTKPLAADMDTDHPYFPVYSSAIAMNLVQPDVGQLQPDHQITRGEAKAILDRFLLFQSSNFVEESKEVYWKEMALAKAGDSYASARAILVANGVHAQAGTAEHNALILLSWAMGKHLQNDAQAEQELLAQVHPREPNLVEKYNALQTHTSAPFPPDNFAQLIAHLRFLVTGAFVL